MQRFIPSEFGTDPSRMGHAIEPGKVTFDEKMELRKALEDANIPHTYVSANCFAAYFCPNLGQLGTLLPPKHKVLVYGDGNVKGNPILVVISSPSSSLVSLHSDLILCVFLHYVVYWHYYILLHISYMH
jgi:hypothetical protein